MVVKRLLLLVIVLMFFPCMVSARSKTSCDYTLLSNLKKLSSNIDITYTYRIVDDNVYFDITIANIQNDIYFVDNKNDKTYNYVDTDNGVITIRNYYSGKVKYTFYSNNNECLNEKLSVRYVNLPYYNKYYNYEECIGKNISVCNKWNSSYIDDYTFEKNIKNYNNQPNVSNDEEINKNLNIIDKIIIIFSSYYYIVLPIIIILVVGILYLIKYIRNRRNRFDI